jgi:hypothetical protein
VRHFPRHKDECLQLARYKKEQLAHSAKLIENAAILNPREDRSPCHAISAGSVNEPTEEIRKMVKLMGLDVNKVAGMAADPHLGGPMASLLANTEEAGRITSSLVVAGWIFAQGEFHVEAEPYYVIDYRGTFVNVTMDGRGDVFSGVFCPDPLAKLIHGAAQQMTLMWI